jgi:hypothetical protein
MQRISTTVIALVGEQARACAKGLGGAANIRVELPDPAAPPLERAAAAWQASTGSFPIRYHTLGRLERLPGWRECAEGDRRDLGAQRQPGSDGQEPPLRGEC